MMHTDKIFLEFKKLHAKEIRRKNLEKMRKEQEFIDDGKVWGIWERKPYDNTWFFIEMSQEDYDDYRSRWESGMTPWYKKPREYGPKI